MKWKKQVRNCRWEGKQNNLTYQVVYGDTDFLFFLFYSIKYHHSRHGGMHPSNISASWDITILLSLPPSNFFSVSVHCCAGNSSLFYLFDNIRPWMVTSSYCFLCQVKLNWPPVVHFIRTGLWHPAMLITIWTQRQRGVFLCVLM